MIQTTKLKPCIKCGSDGKLFGRQDQNNVWRFVIRCPGCHNVAYVDDSLPKAVQAWNDANR